MQHLTLSQARRCTIYLWRIFNNLAPFGRNCHTNKQVTAKTSSNNSTSLLLLLLLLLHNKSMQLSTITNNNTISSTLLLADCQHNAVD